MTAVFCYICPVFRAAVIQWPCRGISDTAEEKCRSAVTFCTQWTLIDKASRWEGQGWTRSTSYLQPTVRSCSVTCAPCAEMRPSPKSSRRRPFTAPTPILIRFAATASLRRGCAPLRRTHTSRTPAQRAHGRRGRA